MKPKVYFMSEEAARLWGLAVSFCRRCGKKLEHSKAVPVYGCPSCRSKRARPKQIV